MTDQQQPNPHIPAWAQQSQQPTGWGPAPQPPKKKHRGLKIAGGVVGGIIAISIIASAASGGSKKGDDQPAAAAPTASASASGQPAAAPSTKAAPAPTTTKPKPKAPDQIEYIVTGSPSEVTYGPAGSDLSGRSGMDVKKKLGHPTYYSISAQLSGSGSVKCEIKVKGKVVSKATATGSYNIAMCEVVQDPFGSGWQDANSN